MSQPPRFLDAHESKKKKSMFYNDTFWKSLVQQILSKLHVFVAHRMYLILVGFNC